MVKIKNHIMWEGMEFKQLALSMSSEKESFDAYLTRMAADGVWLDASAIHALATSFKVDVLVWQQGMDQTILGHSLTPGASPALQHRHGQRLALLGNSAHSRTMFGCCARHW